MDTLLPGGNRKFWMAAVHTAIWIIYIGFLYAANRLSDPTVKLGHAILFMLPFCAVFYISLFWLRRYKHMGAFLSILSFLGTFLLLGTAGYIYMYMVLPAAKIQLYESDKFRHFVKAAVLGYVQYYSYALLYFVVEGLFQKERTLSKLREEKYIRELENAKLQEQELQAQKDKLQMEYAFLRAQVNPHFLHNSLNTLYSQAMEYSDELADNISKLARMMRYSFETLEEESDIVHVEKELKNLKLLIEINDIRFDGQKHVELNIEGAIEQQFLPPFSLITIVENAFKYGDLTDLDHPLKINVQLKPGEIFFFCRNKKRPKPSNIVSHNIGVTNLRKRLDVSFKDKYKISTENVENFYSIELYIKS